MYKSLSSILSLISLSSSSLLFLHSVLFLFISTNFCTIISIKASEERHSISSINGQIQAIDQTYNKNFKKLNEQINLKQQAITKHTKKIAEYQEALDKYIKENETEIAKLGQQYKIQKAQCDEAENKLKEEYKGMLKQKEIIESNILRDASYRDIDLRKKHTDDLALMDINQEKYREENDEHIRYLVVKKENVNSLFSSERALKKKLQTEIIKRKTDKEKFIDSEDKQLRKTTDGFNADQEYLENDTNKKMHDFEEKAKSELTKQQEKISELEKENKAKLKVIEEEITQLKNLNASETRRISGIEIPYLNSKIEKLIGKIFDNQGKCNGLTTERINAISGLGKEMSRLIANSVCAPAEFQNIITQNRKYSIIGHYRSSDKSQFYFSFDPFDSSKYPQKIKFSVLDANNKINNTLTFSLYAETYEKLFENDDKFILKGITDNAHSIELSAENKDKGKTREVLIKVRGTQNQGEVQIYKFYIDLTTKPRSLKKFTYKTQSDWDSFFNSNHIIYEKIGKVSDGLALLDNEGRVPAVYIQGETNIKKIMASRRTIAEIIKVNPELAVDIYKAYKSLYVDQKQKQ
ncbi:MAG: hypothetical protein HQK51_05490 [Oligoflexia bacterium]|nr:hypothetical protein [Oligoflexia bacterium]